jgi:uncharacterized integral membrane protein
MENEREPAESPPVDSSPTPPAAPQPPQAPPAPAPPEIPPHTHDRELGPVFFLKLAALLFFIGYAIAFVIGNHKTIPVDFVFATGRVSLIWTILLILLLGVLAGALFAHLYRRHGRKKIRKP